VAHILRTADALALHGYAGEVPEHLNSGAGHIAVRRKAWQRYRPMSYLLIGSGVRIGEALALQWKDIDFETGSIRVEKTVDGDGKVGPPKTRSSVRTIPLGATMMAMLGEMPGPHNLLHYILGGAKPASRTNLRKRAWLVLMAAAGMLDEEDDALWSFHDCRHFHASFLIASGMDAHQVSERLGHANVTTTQRIYVHLFKAQRGLRNVRAVELEGGLFGLPAPAAITD
jgi:integrase